jgi:hypothetical protein
MADFSKIKQEFEAYFEPWGIQLAPEKLVRKARGTIQEAGWHIEYLLSADQKGDYLDYYASHRMTNDRHWRIYADGSMVGLPEIEEMYTSGDEEAFFKRNREVSEMLKAKGFGA